MKTLTPHFFKKESNDFAEEIKKVIPINVNTDFDSIAPAIASAEEDYIKPILGEPLFGKLANSYQDGNPQTKEDEVILGLQYAIIRYAYWDSFDQLSVNFSDAGLADMNGENRVYRYQADNFKDSLYRQASTRLNHVIGMIEENIKIFPEFEKSEYYSNSKDSLISNLHDFNLIVNINNDFRLFQQLRQYISTTEKLELTFRLGANLVEKITENQSAYSKILPAIKSFVANWSMAEAVPFLKMNPAIGGFWVESERSVSGGRVKNQPTEQNLSLLSAKHRESAERFISIAIRYIQMNPDLFPEYETKDKNTTIVSKSTHVNVIGNKIILA